MWREKLKSAGIAVTGWMRNVNIFNRLFIMFIFATLLPLIMTEVWSYRKSSSVIQEKVFISVNEVMNQLSSNVDKKIEKVRNDSIEISYMPEIQDVLSNYEEYNSRMLNSAKVNITQMMSTKYVFDNIVSSITLYTLEHQRVNVYGEDIYNVTLEGEFLEAFLEECDENDGKCVFRAVNGEDARYRGRGNKQGGEIVIGKVVKQRKSGAVIGYMVMQVDESNFSDIYKAINQEKWIFPFQENADATFNSSLLFELGVLKDRGEEVLRHVPHNIPEYAEAARLRTFLSYFHPIGEQYVPSTSLLREFLGGSSFKY